jgi:tRNA-modifying protein YgfZ
MPFKPETAPRSPVALAGSSLLAVSGRDAAAFLQAQTMNDVAALAPGRWQWSGWLTPKGRVVALFLLLRTGDDTFLLVLPDHPAPALRDALQRYVFRSRVVLDAAAPLVAAAGPVHPGAAGADAAPVDGGWALDLGGDGGARTLWLLPPALVAPADPAADAAWRAFDIAHGIPRLGPDQREAWTPQMLALERLGAFSLKKGCYPGQEIVARTHWLGQARRTLARIRGDGLAEGAGVEAGGRGVGTVICVTPSGDGLAVVSADAAGPLASAGKPLETPGLNGGVSRSA